MTRSIRFQTFAGMLALFLLSAGAFLVVVPSGEGFVLFGLVNAACLMAAAAVLRTLVTYHVAARADRLQSYLPDEVIRELCAEKYLSGMHKASVFESAESLVAMLGEHIKQQNELLRVGFSESFGQTLNATTAQLAAEPLAGESLSDSQADFDFSSLVAHDLPIDGESAINFPDEQALAKLRAELAALQDQFNTDVHLFKRH